jgi:phage terminase large subunit-like protein
MKFIKNFVLDSKEQYLKLLNELQKLNEVEKKELIRYLCKTDLFFLCWFVFEWSYYYNNFAFQFCKEVQERPNRLFLVARGHLKSKTVTIAKVIQDLLNNPELCVAIISYNLMTAKSFLREIKLLLENNNLLKTCFPDILYLDPGKKSDKWSEQLGINIKRQTLRKEPSIFAFGLVDSQATGYHFDILNYDDTVIQDSVTTPEMIAKTTAAWELSDNLGMIGEGCITQKRYCGTRYHYYDTYSHLLKLGIPSLVIPATDNGEIDGNPVFISKEQLQSKLIEQGSYIFSCQNLLKPVIKVNQVFDPEKITYYDHLPSVNYNYYIAVDPANSKKANADYTAMIVFAYSSDRKVYIVDIVHDRLNLAERYSQLMRLNAVYCPLKIGYEGYGMQSDIDFFRIQGDATNNYLPIFKIGGSLKKEDRIRRISGLYEFGKLIFPKNINYLLSDGGKSDIMQIVKQELFDFPFGKHDDLLDAISRCYDIFLTANGDSIEQREHINPNSMRAYMEQQTEKNKY